MEVIKIRILKITPKLITIGNLTVGLISIKMVLENNFYLALIFILIAIVLDSIDGIVARKLKVVTSLGRELDSLSDIVSFGVAPVILGWAVFSFEPHWTSFGLALFPICGAYRLARFNTESKNNFFKGLPIPPAGGLIAVLSFYGEVFPQNIILIIVAILSLSMISNIPFYSFGVMESFSKVKNFYIIIIIIIMIIFSIFYPFIVAILFTFYYFSNLFLYYKN